MSAAMTAQLVIDALVMASWRRGKPDAVVHHSDRGSQYSSEQFQRLMADHGVVCSMSRVRAPGIKANGRADTHSRRKTGPPSHKLSWTSCGTVAEIPGPGWRVAALPCPVTTGYR
jgi:transposase InsO family protein